MRITNVTNNNLELNAKMSEHIASKKFRLLMLTVAVIILICGLIVLSLDIFSPDEDGIDLFMPIMCFIGVAVFGFIGAAFPKLIRYGLKKTMQGKESVNAYTFTDTGYSVKSELNDGTTSEARGLYTGLTQVREYNDMWLLYINKATVFIVYKFGMGDGSVEELSQLLKLNLNERYKIYYKVK